MVTLVVDTRLMAYLRFHRGQPIPPLTYDVASLYYRTALGAGLPVPTKVVWAMDNGKSRRAEKFSEYKAHRKERDKQKGPEYEERLREFNTTYKNLEDYLSCFGSVVSLPGVEADDVASVISKSSLADGSNTVVLLSSDSDWVKFLSPTKNVYILSPSKNALISYKDAKKVFGYSPEEKVIMDSLVGVSKENVKGLFRFGPKTFMRILEEVGGNLEAVVEEVSKIYNGSDKIPEPFSSVEEMYEFNYELFRQWTIKDLTEPEQETLKEALGAAANTRCPSDVRLEKSFELFGQLYTAYSAEEQKIFKISA